MGISENWIFCFQYYMCMDGRDIPQKSFQLLPVTPTHIISGLGTIRSIHVAMWHLAPHLHVTRPGIVCVRNITGSHSSARMVTHNVTIHGRGICHERANNIPSNTSEEHGSTSPSGNCSLVLSSLYTRCNIWPQHLNSGPFISLLTFWPPLYLPQMLV